MTITSDFKTNIQNKSAKQIISEFEIKLGIIFPVAFNKLLLLYNNFSIGNSEIIYGLGFKHPNNTIVLNNIIIKKLEIKKFFKNLPIKIIPFCPNGDGSEWAFDYRNLKVLNEPTVVLIDHELYDSSNFKDLSYIITMYEDFEHWIDGEWS